MKINGERHYLWRAVDHQGKVEESFVTRTRFLKKAKEPLFAKGPPQRAL